MIRLKAILLISIFTLSNLASALELHYCHDELSEINLVGQLSCHCGHAEAETTDVCCEDELPVDHSLCSPNGHEHHEMHEHDCCESEVIPIGSSEVVNTTNTLHLPAVIVQLLFDASFFVDEQSEKIVLKPLSVSLYQADRQVLLQTFLI